MTEGALLVVSLVVSGLTLAGLAALAVFIIRRLPRTSTGEPDTRLNQIAADQRRLARAIHPLVASGQPLESVVTRLTFAESFDPERFAVASRESALCQLNSLLKARAADGIMVTVNNVQLARSGAVVTVSASKEGQMLLSQGKAVLARHGQSGRVLPILKDARTGKTIQIMKGAPAAKALSRLGAMSSAVVGAAHIVAGADIAKRLKLIDSKVNLLLAYRRIDQTSKLERIYTSAKELGSGPMNQDKRWELWRLRGELRELRYSWRRELQHHLNLIDDPKEAGWFKRTFTMLKTSDRNIQGKITEGQLQMGLIDYSMRLDQALAVGSGTLNEFEGTLAGELCEFEGVARLLEEKADLISGKYPDLSVEPTVRGMKALVKQYKRLLPDDSTSLTGQAVLSPPDTEEQRHADD